MIARLQTQNLVARIPVPTFKPVRFGPLQRKCACKGAPGLDGECEECRKKQLNLQRRPLNGTDRSTVPSIVNEVLSSPGQPLDPATRALMESRLGYDFSQVQVHADTKAMESAEILNASAYTVGSHVVFSAGGYAPETAAGRRLLAHELAHTVQQSVGNAPRIQRQIKFDPCVESPLGKVCGSDAVKVCEAQPSLPGCDAVCKIFGCKKPETPAANCPPGFRAATTSEFKGQCCRSDIENATDCCPPVRAAFKDLRCCAEDEVVSDGHCVKSSELPPLPSIGFCLPSQKTILGECCIPPLIPQGVKCDLPPVKPPDQPPTPSSTVEQTIQIRFKKDAPQTWLDPRSSLSLSVTSEGDKDFKRLVDLMQKQPQLQVQLEGHASSERPPGDTGDYNQRLTERRVRLITNELENGGIAKARIGDLPGQPNPAGCVPLDSGIHACGDVGAKAPTADPADRNVTARVFSVTTK